ncbi:MAG: hypothetical protein MRECE_12c035 [Mycoplasmataceae bacterium CE_OT135]|nr:MAG: hypothetical protein MRECE_12c035 [Mycoplasmataceae bacterium CE_OT135]
MENHQLIIIKSVMKPKNYSTLRALLKEEQGEKITPYIFKLVSTHHVCEYLEKERINFEVYEKKLELGEEKKIKVNNLREKLKKAMIKY